MMRLPSFVLRCPRTIEEAAVWLGESPADTMLLAGGTDVVPNMKRRQQTPRTLIALRQIEELRSVRHNAPSTALRAPRPFDRLRVVPSSVEGRASSRGGHISIGAGVTLSALTRDARLRSAAPGLWQAAAQVATPHLRNMATIGGNLCLDTR